MWAYPRETTIAEKFEAMVRLGAGNSRMKGIPSGGLKKAGINSVTPIGDCLAPDSLQGPYRTIAYAGWRGSAPARRNPGAGSATIISTAAEFLV